MTRRSRLALALPVALALWSALLAGCAALMPAQSAPEGAAPEAGATSAGAAAGAVAQPRAAVDSLPSAEAERVLATLPEPIPAAERVPPPAAAPDTARSDSVVFAPDTSGAAVPVPAPTAPLGDKPGSAELAAAAGALAVDSLAARGGAASGAAAGAGGATTGGAATGGKSGGAAGSSTSSAGAATGAAAAGAKSTAAESGPCYRLQVAAPTDRKQAENMKQAAESQLELPFTVAKVKTLYKVRTRDCLSADAAQHLKQRARASGFGGAFVVAPESR